MFQIELPTNETIRSYEPSSPERDTLKSELARMAQSEIDIPCWIGGKEVRTEEKRRVVMPHEHRHVLAEFHLAGKAELERAAQAALKAKPAWESLPWSERVAIF